jgi:hypothetical protein
MKAAITDGILCVECGEQVPSKEWVMPIYGNANQ